MCEQKVVYLAGNIAGLKYEDTIAWRTTMTNILSEMGYKSLDPMRDKEHLSGEVIGFTHNSVNCSANEIFARDINDIDNCDIVFANIVGFSIGTSFELGYAYARGKTIIVVASGAVEGHPFLTECADLYTNDIAIAINYLKLEA